MPVDYDLTGQATELLQSLSSVITELSKSIDATNKLKEAEAKLAEEEKKLAEQEKKLAEAAAKKSKSFSEAAEVASNVKEVLGSTVEVVKGTIEGMIALAREVTDARDELAGFMDQADRDSLDNLADRFEVLDKAVLILKKDVVTELSPGIETMIDTFLGATEKAGGLVDKLYDLSEAGREALSWITFGASDQAAAIFETITEDGSVAREELELLIAAEKEWNDAVEEGERLAELWGKQAEEASAKAEKAKADELAQLEQLQKREQQYREWYRDARLGSIEADAQAAADYIATVLERNEEELDLWQEHQDELADIEKDKLKERTDAQKEAAFAILAAWTAMFEDLSSMSLETRQSELDAIQERRDALREQLKDAEKGEKERLREKLKAIEEEEAAAKAAAKEAFNRSQAAAVASVISSAAAAFAAMLLTFAPLGFGAPLAAGLVTGPTVAAQLAAIGKNKPPAHDGTMGADEFVFGNRTVRDGEGAVVLNQRAVQNGAMARVAAENRGTPSSGAPAVLVLNDFSRTVATAAVRDSRRPGSPFATSFGTAKTGIVDPYRRSR